MMLFSGHQAYIAEVEMYRFVRQPAQNDDNFEHAQLHMNNIWILWAIILTTIKLSRMTNIDAMVVRLNRNCKFIFT